MQTTSSLHGLLMNSHQCLSKCKQESILNEITLNGHTAMTGFNCKLDKKLDKSHLGFLFWVLVDFFLINPYLHSI